MSEKNVEENIEKKEEKDTINNNQEDEIKNMKADKLTNIAKLLVFTIPIILWLIGSMGPIFLYKKIIVALFKFVIPLSILSGLTILVYTRIKYPDNLKSKKLVKICIVATIAIVIYYCILLLTCINILSNCEGIPG